MDPSTELFLRFDYGEPRDLLKSFITLISATLVLSVSFHDRVIGREASRKARRLMLAAWALLFFALVMSGVALGLTAAAAACQLYGPTAFPILECSTGALFYASWALIALGGATFVAALGLMILAANRTMSYDHAPPAPPHRQPLRSKGGHPPDA